MFILLTVIITALLVDDVLQRRAVRKLTFSLHHACTKLVLQDQMYADLKLTLQGLVTPKNKVV